MDAEYKLSSEAVLKELDTTEAGLSSAQAKERLEKYGPNKLKEAEKAYATQNKAKPYKASENVGRKSLIFDDDDDVQNVYHNWDEQVIVNLKNM